MFDICCILMTIKLHVNGNIICKLILFKLKELFRYFLHDNVMIWYWFHFTCGTKYHNMVDFKQIRWIEKIAWFKLHFNKNKKKSFMKHSVLDDNIWLLWAIIFVIWPFFLIYLDSKLNYLLMETFSIVFW
jgi:hypothetical protein